MGWSCSAKANEVLRKWENACRQLTNSSNMFVNNGQTYFFEVSRKEHQDGAITGSIFKIVYPNTPIEGCVDAGSFRINGDGSIKTAPKFLKDAANGTKIQTKTKTATS